MNRPHTTVVLAMSADGKIADAMRSPTLFGSKNDKAHLENQVAQADGILMGANTLRAGESAVRVLDLELLKQREQQGKPPQPVQIVCSRLADLNPQYKFFHQPVPRWLITSTEGAQRWQDQPGFDRIIAAGTVENGIDWQIALPQLHLERLAVLGGGEIVASLVEDDLIDEFWLTVCPLIIGGATAPTPVQGNGFPTELGLRLELLSVQQIEQELFLHYRRIRHPN